MLFIVSWDIEDKTEIFGKVRELLQSAVMCDHRLLLFSSICRKKCFLNERNITFLFLLFIDIKKENPHIK